MKKEKKIFVMLILIGVFLAILAVSSNVNAANITYKTEYYSGIDTAIYVNGLENNLEEGYSYYIYVTQDNTTTEEDIFSKVNVAHCDSLFYDSENNQFYLKVSSYNWGNFEKKGDYYAYIVKGKITYRNTFTLIDGPTKLQRPELLPNGERITAYFNEGGASYYISQYSYYTKLHGTDRKVNFYLGKIEDTTILEKLTQKTSDAQDVLYNYAKNKSEYLYSGSFDTTSTGVLNYNIWKDYTGFENGGYYFVYFKLDDENGKYAEMDDVQAYTYNSEILGSFVAYNPGNKPEEEQPDGQDTNPPSTPNVPSTPSTPEGQKDETTTSGTLPYTGNYLKLTVAIVLLVIIGIYCFYRYKKLKNI